MRASAQFACRCQKHPCTKMTLPRPPEHEVGTARQFPVVQPVAVALGKNETTHQHFRPGVLRTDARHDLRSLGWRNVVHTVTPLPVAQRAAICSRCTAPPRRAQPRRAKLSSRGRFVPASCARPGAGSRKHVASRTSAPYPCLLPCETFPVSCCTTLQRGDATYKLPTS